MWQIDNEYLLVKAKTQYNMIFDDIKQPLLTCTLRERLCTHLYRIHYFVYNIFEGHRTPFDPVKNKNMCHTIPDVNQNSNHKCRN